MSRYNPLSGKGIATVIAALAAVSLFGWYIWNFSANTRTAEPELPPEVKGFLSSVPSYAPKAHCEHEAVRSLLITTETEHQPHGDSSSDKMLCVTFISLKLPNIQRSVNNSALTEQSCHWIYLIYSYDNSTKDAMLATFHESLKILPTLSYEIVLAPRRAEALEGVIQLCRTLLQSKHYRRYGLEGTCAEISAAHHGSASVAGNFNGHIYPKVLQFLYLVPHLRNHPYVWIVDGDMSVQGFDFKAFVQVARCAFPSPALVAQPVIAQNTQAYPYLNRKGWDGVKNSEGKAPIAAQTGFVEIQTPMLERRFFEWYVLKIVLPMAVPMHVLGADWGFDEVFCRSARLYYAATTDVASSAASGLGVVNHSTSTGTTASHANADHHHNTSAVLAAVAASYATAKQTDGKVNPQLKAYLQRVSSQCMVILPTHGVGAMQHENSRETSAAVGGAKSNVALNGKMRSIVQAAFPSLYGVGYAPLASPLEPSTGMQRSYELRQGCGL